MIRTKNKKQKNPGKRKNPNVLVSIIISYIHIYNFRYRVLYDAGRFIGWNEIQPGSGNYNWKPLAYFCEMLFEREGKDASGYSLIRPYIPSSPMTKEDQR